MGFLPFDRMWERVNNAREDSDTSLFLQLLYFGEMLVKIVGAAMVTAIKEDRDRHRYRQLHGLVRADSLGRWSDAIEDTLTGPPSQFLTPSARTEQKELTEKCRQGTWQYEALSSLSKCLKQIDPQYENIPAKAAARRWFPLFVQVRNSTRGHGVTRPTDCGRLCHPLEDSIRLFCDNFHLFQRPWAYLHRNLSGRYRVTKLTNTSAPFDNLKSTADAKLEDGLYIHFDDPVRAELISSDPEASDFLFPNGAFNGKQFELISYLTGNKLKGNAAPYLIPTTELPQSHTQGMGLLDVQGALFGNLPPMARGYVTRRELESELFKRLYDDRHCIITLHGSGGIGKASLALAVLHQLSEAERFAAMLWFSSRDIDLLAEGPRVVQARVLTETEIAQEFVQLMQPSESVAPDFQALTYLSQALSISPLGKPMLFVFDNFETVRSPAELFAWIDTYVRPPNKILITTRLRDFKGDYPVEVLGMSEQECEQLCDEVAGELGVRKLITQEYRRELFQESDGHPYVIKILLGEIVKAGRLGKIERIVASRDDILEALFERTYAGLSPAAKQVFLTLAAWRSTVPELAVEAVMLRPNNEKLDVKVALDELRRSSFIETTTSPDKDIFVAVPLVAAVFGKRKLAASPMKAAVEANVEILGYLGAAQKTDTQHGISRRINAMFSGVAAKIGRDTEELKEYLPIMEFIAQRYPPAWLLRSRLFEESEMEDRLEQAKGAVRRYLESNPGIKEQEYAWQKLATYCRDTHDSNGEIHALVEMSKLVDIDFNEISNAANRVNSLLRFQQFLDIYEIKLLVRGLAEAMSSRIAEGDATDCSRLSWLYLRLGNETEAAQLMEQGLRLEPGNEHCLRLAERLNRG